MLLLSHGDPEFARLIQDLTPRIAGVPAVQKLMEKYTSGYLDKKRLVAAVSLTAIPMVALGKLDDAAGLQSGDNITIDENYFKFYTDSRYPHYRVWVPVTVLHELGHWGYWKGQQEGNKSDEAGRAHNNHGENLSPLTRDLQQVLWTLIMMGVPL
jgi:hypothetical protein